MVGHKLSAKIAQHLVGNANICAHEIVNRRVQPSFIVELEDWNFQTLLVDVLRFKRRHAPTHVEMVHNAGGVPDESVPVKDGGGYRDVDQMTAGEPRIVGDQDIPRLERFWRMLFDEVL